MAVKFTVRDLLITQGMNSTWILVANQGGARLFECMTPHQGLNRIQDIPNPRGRLKGKDINADKPGRVFKLSGSHMRSAAESENPHEIVINEFARQLASVLDEGHSRQAFANLIIVSDPHLLGRIKNSLSSEVSKALFTSLSKNLNDFNDQGMGIYLKEVVEEAYKDRLLKRTV